MNRFSEEFFAPEREYILRQREDKMLAKRSNSSWPQRRATTELTPAQHAESRVLANDLKSYGLTIDDARFVVRQRARIKALPEDVRARAMDNLRLRAMGKLYM